MPRALRGPSPKKRFPSRVGYAASAAVGAAALAREIGMSAEAVAMRLNRGQTPDEIRAVAQLRKDKIAAGIKVPGKPKGFKHKEADKPDAPSLDNPPPLNVEEGGEVQPLETMLQVQLRKEKGLADQQEMKAAMMRGELVEAAAVELWMTNQIVKARDLFLRIGAELGDRLAAETNPHKCAEMVENKVREALSVMKVEGMPGKEGAVSE